MAEKEKSIIVPQWIAELKTSLLKRRSQLLASETPNIPLIHYTD
jgi:hypothetical protein